jgi:amino acid adenylation domain-containing protein
MRRYVHELFELQAAQQRHALAVVCDGERLSYSELNARANRLAFHLRELGVGPDVIVGIYAYRGLEMVLAVMATLKAGGAYLPLDADLPSPRLTFILEDACPSVILTQAALENTLPQTAVQLVALDRTDEWATLPAGDLLPAAGFCPEAAAYIIYTSGSTGQPKGVVVEHRQIVNYVEALAERAQFPDFANFAMAQPLAYDLSATALYGSLCNGGCLHVIPERTSVDPVALAAYFERASIDCLKITPSHLMALQSGSDPHRVIPKRCLILGGEASRTNWVRNLRAMAPHCVIFNHYGPTETTVGVMMHRVQPGAADGDTLTIPLGEPLQNVRVYVLNERLESVPVGVGELYIAGAALARGYLRRPALTSTRFVADPFGHRGSRMYRTGDVVRRHSDGTLEYRGRSDDQVKVRGFRVELGEIEAALLAQPGVSQAAVAAKENEHGEVRLTAYVIPGKDRTVEPASLRQAIAQKLPEYMVPSSILVLADLPLSAHGKLDRKNLPSGEVAGHGKEVDGPRTPQEEIMVGLFCEALGLNRVGIHESFLDLGGSSLGAIRLVNRLSATLGAEISVAELFEKPTVAELVSLLPSDSGSGESASRPPSEKEGRSSPIPLSSAQKRVWFLHQMAPDNTAYNSRSTMTFDGLLDTGALEKALNAIVERHEILRTTIHVEGDEPIQRVHPFQEFSIDRHVLSGASSEQRRQELQSIVDVATRERFCLNTLPLIRWTLVEVSQQEHVLIQVEHHIVHDGWSSYLIRAEITKLYREYTGFGMAEDLTTPTFQFGDFACWERDWLETASAARQLGYWTSQLSGCPAVLQLSYDRPRTERTQFVGSSERILLPIELCRQIRALSIREGVTLFTTMTAAFMALLARYSGQTDIVTGSGFANRRHPECARTLGMFVNSVVLRCSLADNPPFREFLQRVSKVVLDAFNNQEYPFDKIVEALNPERIEGVNPFFQTLFSFNDARFEGVEIPDLKATVREGIANGSAKFDLNIIVIPHSRARQRIDPDSDPDGITIVWEYSTGLFEPATAHRMIAHYHRILEEAVQDSKFPTLDMEMLSPTERRKLLEEWNCTDTEVPDITMTALLEEQFDRTPTREALVYAGAHLSYRELDERANRLAHYLIGAGIGPEDFVGVLVPRSVELVVCLLGVLRAGAAYLPLQQDIPRQRLSFMLADAAPVCVLTTRQLAGNLPDGARAITVDDPSFVSELERRSPSHPREFDRRRPLLAECPAYVIYTSGSTGPPKGVVVSHRSIVNRLLWMQAAYGLQAEERVLQKTPIGFDVSVWEFFWPLLAGGTLVVAKPDGHKDASYLARLIRDENVSTVHFVPSMLRVFLQEPAASALSGLRRVICSGEALSPAVEAEYFRTLQVPLHNLYGPTEASVDVTSWECSNSAGSVAPIGKPIWNIHAYVLDRNLRLSPPGVIGELYISGVGLARGYLKRSALTAERFVANPYSNAGARMYRTGDLAKWRPDGNLEFAGRVDDQVKIRGFRVELGEIRAVLQQISGVRDAAVVARDDPAGDKRLIAYVVSPDGCNVDGARLRQRLAEVLPDYMLPSAFVAMAELPLGANGKLDRSALPEPDFGPDPTRITEPRTPEEELLCGVFAEVLGLPRVGIHDDFFALGGHSLMITRLISRIRLVLGCTLDIYTVFNAPTVSELAPRLRLAAEARPPLVQQSRPSHLPASYAQRRLWFINQLRGATAEYNVCQALRLRGDLNREGLLWAINEIVRRHESLRTHFIEVDGEPVQVIETGGGIELPVDDLSRIDAESRPRAVTAAMREEWTRPFDLSRGPFLRGRLLKTEEQEHVLLVVAHHIVFDGWSRAIFNKELTALYADYCTGRPGSLRPLPVQYADFALWQRGWFESGALDDGLAYWREQLAGIPGSLQLPTDRPRPPAQTFAAAVCRARLSDRQVAELKALSRREHATLYMTLLSAFGVVLWKYSGQDDIVVGSPIANRQETALEELIGFFVNSLPMRIQMNPGASFRQLLARVRATALAAYQHQDVPFERLVEELAPERTMKSNPLFQVMFALQNAPRESPRLDGIDVVIVEGEPRVRFDLEVHAFEVNGQVELCWNYNRDLFDAWRVEQMVRHYVRVLDAALEDSDLPLEHMNLLASDELQRVLEAFNETE